MTIRFHALVVSAILAHASCARAEGSCTTIVTNAQAAADHADLVIEATVTLLSSPSDRSQAMHVVTEKSRAVFNPAASSIHATMSFPVDACFPDQQHRLSKQALERMPGKRMRFYLTALTNSRGYRLFFMQPVEELAPVFRKTKPGFDTKGYPDAIGTPLSDGWRRAHSTDGRFSIAMPGPFLDATKGGPGEPAFMIRGTDQDGSIYLAVFERAGPEASVAGTFDDMDAKPDAVRVTFKEAAAVSTVGTVPGPSGEMTSYGLWFRVPGGTFMLGFVPSPGHEAQALKNRERFFNSLEFN